MRRKRTLLISAGIALAGACVPTAFVVGAMVDHNPQGEFYDTVTGRWDVAHVLTGALLWYVPAFLIIFLFTLCLLLLGRADES